MTVSTGVMNLIILAGIKINWYKISKVLKVVFNGGLERISGQVFMVINRLILRFFRINIRVFLQLFNLKIVIPRQIDLRSTTAFLVQLRYCLFRCRLDFWLLILQIFFSWSFKRFFGILSGFQRGFFRS